MSVKSEERYGRLRVLGVANRTTAAAGHKYFRCVCDCGREVEVRGTHLSQGRTTSCGCSRRGARGGIENYRARCNDEERRREAVEAAARMMAEARWSAPDADREQPRKAGRNRGRAEDPPPAPPPAPAPICGRCGWETAPPRERICARCGWVMMAWQVEKEHDALCVAVHEKYGDPLKAKVELRCLYAELLERAAEARRAEQEDPEY